MDIDPSNPAHALALAYAITQTLICVRFIARRLSK
jgi:hypothetical protein